MPKLEDLGWSAFFASQLTDDERDGGRRERGDRLAPARVIAEQKRYLRLATEAGECWAEPVGKLTHAAATRADLPAVGDWVVASLGAGSDRARIERVLRRRTKLSRRAAGEGDREQIVAANVDLVFVATSLNQELNLGRLKRYLEMVAASGAGALILLTKCDLASDYRERAAALAAHGEVLCLSIKTGEGLSDLRERLTTGLTAAFVGSSGVGKSTIVNWLAGEDLQETRDVREDDDRGRHTTTSRRLVSLARGMVIDTPGMRELQAWLDGDTAEDFSDIEQLATRCRFSNCAHVTEPKCAVKAALADGSVDAVRVARFIEGVAAAAKAPRGPKKS